MRRSRKILALLFVCFITILLMACGSTGEENSSGKTSDSSESIIETSSAKNEETEDDTQENMQAEQSEESGTGETDTTNDDSDTGSDTLVVYFSRTGEQYNVGVIDKGNTEIVADMIIEETRADRFEIVPAEDYYPYTYDELTDIAKQEQNENARPAYAGEVPDLSQYSTIYIGAPVWWGDWPMICYTFFENNADGLAGKTLIPFSTHAGSGLSGFDNKLASACPNSAIGTGLAISGSDAQSNQDSVRSAVQDWMAAQ